MTKIVKFPEIGDIIQYNNLGHVFYVTLVLEADREKLKITELYHTGELNTYYVGNNYSFLVLVKDDE